MLAMAVLAAYGARHGIEVLGRYALVILPVLAVSLLLLLPLLGQSVMLSRLQPILENGSLPLLGSFAYAPVGFAAPPFILTLAAMVSDRPRLARQLHTTLLWHLALNLPFSALMIAVMGESLATTANFPGFVLVRGIEVADFIERVEALFMAMIGFGYFLRAAFFLFAAAVTLAEILRHEDYRPLVLPLVPTLWASASLIADSQQEYKAVVLSFVLVALTWCTGFLAPLALLLIDSLRRTLGRGRTGPMTESSPS